jgi:hypothetical protein
VDVACLGELVADFEELLGRLRPVARHEASIVLPLPVSQESISPLAVQIVEPTTRGRGGLKSELN